MELNEKVSNGVAMLREQGHRVELFLQIEENGAVKLWLKIDEDLATPQEIEHLVDGVYSLSELHELYVRRRADETRQHSSSNS